MAELVIIIVVIILIAYAVGHNSSSQDYKATNYHKDWNREYNKWKIRGVNDTTAHANSFKEVQKDKKDGKYEK